MYFDTIFAVHVFPNSAQIMFLGIGRGTGLMALLSILPVAAFGVHWPLVLGMPSCIVLYSIYRMYPS